MEGLKVVCPNCKRRDFVTTDSFDIEKTPNGSMVRCLLPYTIDWLCKPTTPCAEMACPECMALLAPQGRLTVIMEEGRAAGETANEKATETGEAGVTDAGMPEESTVPKEDEAAQDCGMPKESDALKKVKKTKRAAARKKRKASKKCKMPKQNDAEATVPCPVCGKMLKTEFALKGHMISHRAK